jgi:hypothetical protein
MGSGSSTAQHQFSSDEKAQISRVLQTKYQDAKHQHGENDVQLFEALKK